jgi:Uma2 family endonuclease
MSTTITALLTAQEYAQVPDNGLKTELVRGRIVAMNMPTPRHGEICVNIVVLVGTYVKQLRLGRLVSNDSGILTEHNPDTVRGADVAFYSYQRVAEGPLPEHYLDVAPELIFEVRSPGDRWAKNHTKVAEYLQAGVVWVCVLDEQTRTAHLFHATKPPSMLTADEELYLPDVLGEFRVQVARFFD